MGLLACITHPLGALAYVLGFTLVTAVIVEMLNVRMMQWVRTRPWFERMVPLQKRLMMNFGYPESSCGKEACLEAYCFVICICGDHLIMGLAMLPVALLGWERAGPTGQLLFVIGGLGDVAYSVYDWVKTFCKTFFPESFETWGVRTPLPFFILMHILHHAASITMMVPMLVYHTAMREFHLIAISLLLAAGICFLSGSYKFTLDTESRNDALCYKAIVLLQFTTIWLTRGYVWFTQGMSLLSAFYVQGDTAFFIGSLVTGTGMTLFNLVMLIDATSAALKWLPKPLPTDGGYAALL